MHGILVVDKPTGMTSARVVSRVKRALNVKKVGHTGTLDPMATGVLPLCIGEGTKVAGYLLASDKAYEGEFLLGVETDTLDREGQVTRSDPHGAQAVRQQDLKAVITSLIGEIEQIPPMFSALKKDGKRLHELARKGQVVEREPRPITVHRFEVLSLEGLGTESPRVRFRVQASKGTYVRSLARDVGAILGCGAHLTSLRRTQAGQFTIDAAQSLRAIEDGANVTLIDPAAAVGHLPCELVEGQVAVDIGDGKRLPWASLSNDPAPDGPMAIRFRESDQLLAIAEVDGGRLRYRRVFRYGIAR